MNKILIMITLLMFSSSAFAATDYNSSRSNKNLSAADGELTATGTSETRESGSEASSTGEADASIKIGDIKGEAKAFIKIDDIKGEAKEDTHASTGSGTTIASSTAKAYVKIEGVAGESNDKSNSSSSKKGYDHYKALADQASVNSISNWAVTTDKNEDFETRTSVNVKSTQRVKLFGFISMDMTVRGEMNAEGEISNVNRPWYSIFTW